LLAALGEGRSAAPQAAAKAQAAYDCWVEEQEEAWQTDQIAACQATFEEAMDALAAAMVKPEPVVQAPAPTPQLPTFYTVFFGFDESTLTPIGQAVLDQLLNDYGTSSAPMDLVGHADRSGADAYNKRLSERRAESVRAYLANRGLAADKLRASGMGEAQLNVQTADGVREARNRRVVISIETQ